MFTAHSLTSKIVAAHDPLSGRNARRRTAVKAKCVSTAAVTLTGMAFLSLGLTELHAATVNDYMIIATGDSELGTTFHGSDDEYGAIGYNTNTSPPSHGTILPDALELDGDIAITDPTGTVSLSNTDTHHMGGGAGSQGFDCAGSFNTCTDNGSQITSNNRENQSAPIPSFGTLSEGNGIQGGIDHSGLLTELAFLGGQIAGFAATDTFSITTDITSNRLDTFGSGLNVVDIFTDGNNLNLNNADWTISGSADTFVIFRLNEGALFDISNGNLLLDGLIGLQNVLFAVNADQGEASFNFDNATFFGFSFWDIWGSRDNEVVWNDVQGCGQVVTDQVNFNNVSMTQCAFRTTVIPLPASLPLYLMALLLSSGIGILRRRASPADSFA